MKDINYLVSYSRTAKTPKDICTLRGRTRCYSLDYALETARIWLKNNFKVTITHWNRKDLGDNTK